MSSVYFPAHVVVLFRRIVNVVSTISISNQYVLSTQSGLADDTVHSKTGPSNWSASSKQSFAYFQDLEWPWWTHWDGVSVVGEDIYAPREIRKAQGLSARDDYGKVLKASLGGLNFPNWIPDNWVWRNLFSSYQPEVNMPGPDNEPPPPPPNRKCNEEPEKHRREPSKEPIKAPRIETSPDIIHQLLVHPALFDPIRTPRYPIVLCHGLYGFDSRGPSSFPSMRMHYWSNVLRVLRGKVGAEVIVTSVPGTGSIPLRAARLDEQLQTQARGRGINFLAHSMGGLDCRHLISRIRPPEYAPLSLTTISTPHRGSPFMDWCASNIGIGKIRQQEKDHAKRRDIEEFSWHVAAEDPVPKSDPESPPKSSSETSFSLSSLPSSFATLLLSIVDSPAYANLTSHFLNDVFNPANPDDPRVKYFSVAGRISAKSVSVWHPFWLPKMVLDGVEEKERERLKKVWELENDGRKTWDEKAPFWADESQWGNDGLVTVQSARWGEFLGTMEGCDHWEMRGARGIEFGVDLPAIPAIGLGSSPHKTSSGSTQTVQGDGWGFGDWTRFVGAWKKSKADDAAAAKAINTDNARKIFPEELEVQRQKMDTISVSPPSPPSSSETPKEGQQRDRSADDLGVKSSSSTDALSVVFDWLIERVPAPKQILGRPLNSTTTVLTKTSEADGATESKATFTDKEMSAVAVSLTAGPSSSSPTPNLELPPSAPPASEMKLRMEREDKGRKKNELASKEDLERFYVALSRKMYDEGL